MDIIVEEMPTGEIAAGAGTGTDGTTVFSLTENNYLGEGLIVDTSLEASESALGWNISSKSKL